MEQTAVNPQRYLDSFSERLNTPEMLLGYKCPKCGKIPSISFENRGMEIQCKNDHIFSTLDTSTDFLYRSMAYNLNTDICSVCQKTRQCETADIFSYCPACDQKICSNCIAAHRRKFNVHSTIPTTRMNTYCFPHKEKYIYFCEQCKTNCCIKCTEHKEHLKTQFFEILPEERAMKLMLQNIELYQEKITLENKKFDEIMEKVKVNFQSYCEAKRSELDFIRLFVISYQTFQFNYTLISNVNKIIKGYKGFQEPFDAERFIKDFLEPLYEDDNLTVRGTQRVEESVQNQGNTYFTVGNIEHPYTEVGNNAHKENIDDSNIDKNVINTTVKNSSNRNNDFNKTLKPNKKQPDDSAYKTLTQTKENLSSTFDNFRTFKNMKNMVIPCENEITIFFEINKKNINTEIIFLGDNCTSQNASNIYNNSQVETPEEINKYNTKMYIDNNQVPFSRSYTFTSLGKHKIIYKFKNPIRNCKSLFENCFELEHFDLSKFNTSECADMSQMFASLNKLYFVNLSNLDTSNCNAMTQMFAGCSVLTSIDMSSCDLQNVTSMREMFLGCIKLSTIKMMGKLHNEVDTEDMFYNLPNKGIFICNKKYNYNRIISRLPKGWEIVKK